MREIDDGAERFEEAMRAWAAREPRTPAAVARHRVVARLPVAGASVHWLRLAAAAALVVVTAVAVWRGAPRPTGVASARSDIVAQAPLDPNVVVWVLDDRTTVYFVLGPGGPATGGVS